jgi:O-antigen/teichoic acid export membrane protein
MAHVKHNPVLLPVLLLTALRFPLGALGTVSYTRLSVDLRWGVVGMVNLLMPLVTAVTSLAMAYLRFGVYSLVIPPILGDLSRGFVSWLLAGKHIRLRPDMTLISGIVTSSVWIVLSNLTLSARGVSDYLTLSFTRDEHETGLYFYGFVMAQAVARLALGAGPAVLGPVFSKVKHDQARHADIMIRAIHMFASIAILAIVMQAAMTWPLFRVFLNPKWLPAAPIFCIITLMILACFLNVVMFQAFWAHGLYKQFFSYSIIFTPFMLLLFVIGVKLAGPIGVAWANTIAGAIDFIIFPLIALPMLKVPWKPTIIPLWRPLAAAAPTALLAYILHYALPATKIADVLCLLITGVVGSVVYLLILWILWRQVIVATFMQVFAALGVRKR